MANITNSQPNVGSTTSNVPTLPTTQQLTEGLNNTLASAQTGIADAKANISNTLNQFSSANVMNASSDFLNSNSAIAKFGFMILVLIVFLVLLRIGTAVIAYMMSPSKQPYLVKGLLRGSLPVMITQDPADTKSPVVYRSNNQTGGIEFTWSVWLTINSLGSNDKRAHIFNKGNNIYFTSGQKNGLATVNNSPGLYVDVSGGMGANQLVFLMDVEGTSTQTPTPEQITISNIPMNKWFHVAFRLKDYSMDCYVNGVLAQSTSFINKVPKQNYDHVYICQNGGFNGSLSNLRYYDYALSAFDINTLVNYGPNLKPSSLEPKPNGIFDYLGIGWYSAFQ
jgi:hypothetical protein